MVVIDPNGELRNFTIESYCQPDPYNSNVPMHTIDLYHEGCGSYLNLDIRPEKVTSIGQLVQEALRHRCLNLHK